MSLEICFKNISIRTDTNSREKKCLQKQPTHMQTCIHFQGTKVHYRYNVWCMLDLLPFFLVSPTSSMSLSCTAWHSVFSLLIHYEHIILLTKRKWYIILWKVAIFGFIELHRRALIVLQDIPDWDALWKSISIWLNIFSKISILVYGFCLDLLLFFFRGIMLSSWMHVTYVKCWKLVSLTYFIHYFLSF